MLNADLQYFPCYNSFFTLVHFEKVDFRLNQPFVRSTFRNRMVLPSSTGLIDLSIPLVGGRSIKSAYSSVQIDYQSQWQRDHFRTIETIYGKAPFYFAFRDELCHLFQKRVDVLTEWNLICLTWILEKCKLNVNYISDNQIVEINITDRWLPKNHQAQDFQMGIKYPQLFEDRIGFKANVSILDLLFNVGPSQIKKMAEMTKPH